MKNKINDDSMCCTKCTNGELASHKKSGAPSSGGRKEEEEEVRAEIRSLVLPWTSLIALALISALVIVICPSALGHVEHDRPSFTSSSRMNIELPSSSSSSSASTRILENENDKNRYSERNQEPQAQPRREFQEYFMEEEEEIIEEGEDFIENEEEEFMEEEDEEEFSETLFPLSKSDIVGFSLATLGLMLAAGGGIGGGGILVPIYILILGFSPKHAIPLSNVTVFGGAIANTILNVRKRHPLANRPLVDWDLILVMEPLTIAGALMGALLNKILPEALLTVMLVVLLSFTAHKTLSKAFKMYDRESKELLSHDNNQTVAITEETQVEEFVDETRLNDTQQQNICLFKSIELMELEVEDDNHGNDSDCQGATRNNGNGNESSTNNHKNCEDQYLDEKEQDELLLEQILEEEEHPPRLKIMVLIILFVVVLIVNILKGGGAFPSPIGIEYGSTSFWMANLFMLGWIFLISNLVRCHLQKRYEIKKRIGYQYMEGDIQWDSRATVVYPCICSAAGFFAGMFGIGGGIVKGPLMLAMGVHPAVSSASSACMILFTSFTATTSFVVFGLLIMDYALLCLVVGFLATILGQLVLNYLMNRYQRNSYIAFSIGIVVLLSAFLMTIQSLMGGRYMR